MTFNDILKSSFLEKAAKFSLVDSALALLSAFVLGIVIYKVYNKTFSGIMYSRPFGLSLVLLTMLTTFIILGVTSNVVLSLGMVGALSIVRFRTAIKDPLDLVFLFWSIGSGIILGAGMLPLAFLGSLLVGLALVTLKVRDPAEAPYILMLDVQSEAAEVTVADVIRRRFGGLRLKSKTVSGGEIELLYEVRVKTSEQTAFVNELSSMKGVKSAALVGYNGEFAS